MNLTFEEIHIIGFNCFLKKTLVDFTKYSTGLHFLRGINEIEPSLTSNGCGKSSLLNAICWGLYGRTTDGLRNSDIVPWEGYKDTTTVFIQFRLSDRAYFITREANPNRLLLDGKTADQSHIDRLLRINYDAFCHTILFGQDQPLFFDLAPKDKLDLFTTVLELNRWDRSSAAAAAKFDAMTGEIQSQETQATAAVHQLEQLAALIEHAQNQADMWDEERNSVLKDVQTELIKCQKELDHIDKEHATATLAFDSASTELRAIQKQYRTLQLQDTQLMSTWTTEGALLARDLARAQDDLEKLGDGSTCPTCGQSLKGTSIAKHQNELRALIEKLDKEHEARKLPSELDKIRKQSKILVISEKDFQTKADDAQSRLTHLAPELGRLNAKLQGLNENRKKYESDINPHKSQLRDLNKRKSRLITSQKEIAEKLKKLHVESERVKFWIKGFKDVKLFIIEEVLTELELATNSILEQSGLIGWRITYDIERETQSGTMHRGLNVSVLPPRIKRRERAIKFESYSGGEGQRLRLIGSLALSEVLLNYAGLQPNLIFLDEPSRSLSARGIEDLVELLADLAERFKKQIWLVDHHAVESSRFASVTTIVKRKSGSVIETRMS